MAGEGVGVAGGVGDALSKGHAGHTPPTHQTATLSLSLSLQTARPEKIIEDWCELCVLTDLPTIPAFTDRLIRNKKVTHAIKEGLHHSERAHPGLIDSFVRRATSRALDRGARPDPTLPINLEFLE